MRPLYESVKKEKKEKKEKITVDKMFEELRYEKEKRYDGDLFYFQKNGANEKWGFLFVLGSKEIYPVCYSKENEAIYITMQELKAINQKCKELGWL